MKLVILDGFAINPGDLSWDDLAKIGDVTVYDQTLPHQIAERIGDAEAIFTNKCIINEEILEQCPQLKFIGVLATGYDVINLDDCRKRGVAVCNVPAYSSESVAQHTFALILELCNNVALHNEAVQQEKWCDYPHYSMVVKPLFQLNGKSLGIIGYGNIGKRVGEIAEAFGMTIYPYSRDPEKAIKADIITVHCPATAENKGFLNKEFFENMKDGAFLINTARGALVNESDLAEALRNGKLAGAAVDVVSAEPMKKDNVLLGVPNLLITPHIAFTTKEARAVVCTTVAENLSSYLEGGRLNRVD
ncbi:MAG: D-2-hydroxyacid dehydrogenase [Firmicutes bacterium]|nr:D-2-hydroxyacid dehydrogenase [Bacillota bacterium]